MALPFKKLAASDTISADGILTVNSLTPQPGQRILLVRKQASGVRMVLGAWELGYTDGQARAAQLNRVAPAGTTTITLTAESPIEYGTASSGTFTIDPSNCQVGKEAHFVLGPGASAPNFQPAPAGRTYAYEGAAYVSGKSFSYTLHVSADEIIVIVVAR